MATQNFMQNLRKRKEISGLFTFYNASYPQYEIKIDNQMAMQKGVSINTAMENLEVLNAALMSKVLLSLAGILKSLPRQPLSTEEIWMI